MTINRLCAALDQCLRLKIRETKSCQSQQSHESLVGSYHPCLQNDPRLVYQFGNTAILARTPDNFFVCGPAVGQILENTGDLLPLWTHILHFKTFVAP